MSNKSGISSQIISLPKGGGALHGIGEKFAPDLHTGTGNFTIPIALPPGRNGFQPQLSLVYSTGSGNGPFGMGWGLSVPGVSRKTSTGVPIYDDQKDTFILSGAEDLVPVEKLEASTRYRPRTEGLFARILHHHDADNDYWEVRSKDGLVSFYGTPRPELAPSDGIDPAVIRDPDPLKRHVFAWKLTCTTDPFGNRIKYLYERDAVQSDGPHHWDQLDLSKICYVDYGDPADPQFLVTVRFYYENRPDPFSEYRSGFEIRTVRRCTRIEISTHPGVDILTRTYQLIYLDDRVHRGELPQQQLPLNGASHLSQIKVIGHDGDHTEELPPLEFGYTGFEPEGRKFFPIQGTDLPARSLASGDLELADLFGNGLPDILEMNGTVRYWRNLGGGRFALPREMRDAPAGLRLADQGVQLIDANGDSQIDLLVTTETMSGYYPLRFGGLWDRRSFKRYEVAPSFNLEDPEVRLVDLDGDGVTDAVRSGSRLECFFNDPEKGWIGTRRVERRALEVFPNINFSDPRVKWGDMTGDGLQDIVLVHDGHVEYWPALGRGDWAKRISMRNSPRFPYGYDPKRILLGDVDGDGLADLVYVDDTKVTLWINQSGNGWSDPIIIKGTPPVSDMDAVRLADMLGNGIGGILWSSDATGLSREHMFFLDFTGGVKPYLLNEMDNHMGAATRVGYAPSTRFYLEDEKRLNTRWQTPLPFPVQVVARVEVIDQVSGGKLTTEYRYHHGYWDGAEREFRGFARTDQRDTEAFEDFHAAGLHPEDRPFEAVPHHFFSPPVVTKTWFHNGAFLEEGKLEAYFKDPANQEFFTGDAQAVFLPDTDLPTGLSAEEMREAVRALKGSILRQEVYADDGSAKASLPYSVSERSYKLTCLQPQGPNRHAVFFAHPSETIDYHYERNPADPRISHALTLAVDDYGNVLKSVAIGYQRRMPAFDEQKNSLATLTESNYTNAVLEDDAYRTPLPAEFKTFELTAPTLTGARPLDFATVDAMAAAASEIAYEAQPVPGQTQKRLIEQLRTLYRKNDLSALLPLGKLESMALPGESYKLAFTPGLLDIFQGKASPRELTAILTGSEGGYRDLDGNCRLWIPSGQVFYSPTPGDSAPQELAFAQAHFFLPHRFQDPFGNDTVVAYDGYNLLVVSTRDAVGNETAAVYDYRVLQPRMITDPNGNRTEARFDALGMLAGTALRGKETGPVEGDCFDTFTADLTPGQIKDFFDSTDPRALAITHLGTATTRILYDVERIPVCAASIARETHVSDLAPGSQTKVQLHFVYSDGFGREAQTKVQADPGPLDLSDPKSPVANPRWVGTGEKVYNNKGKSIRQYEPFFSATPQFWIETWGVSSTLFYDPVERVVATLHPNNTFEKLVFDPWQQTSFDVNDTVTFDPKTDADVGEFFSRLPDADYLPSWYQQRINGARGPEEKAAAEKAAKHADTPTVAHLDTLGRTFLTVADNGKNTSGNDQKYNTRTILDIEGNQREVIDALDRVVMRYDYDMLGTKIHQASMEAGERFILNDVMGKPIRAWNSRKYAFRTEYDALRRPLRSFVQGGDPAEPSAKIFAQPIIFERTIYGDSPDTGLIELQQKQTNLRTRVFWQYDGAGTVTNYGIDPATNRPQAYDFKGNLLRTSRQFARDYRNPPDWSQNPTLETETFAGATAYDALNRAIAVTTPDKSIYRPAFNEANLLEKVDVNLRGVLANGQPVWTPFVTNVGYNTKGQRTQIRYANGAETAYEYDEQTFRLVSLKTTRAQGQNGLAAQIFNNPATVQDLHYTYDPAGNITRIEDAALKTVFNANQQIDPVCDYTYDALYRLIESAGREHIGQSAFQFNPPDGNYRDFPFVGASQQNDLQALRNYTEHYYYDPVGNFQNMLHHAAGGNWTRTYAFNESSLIEPAKKSNRLSETSLPTNAGAPAEPYYYDAHGNIRQMPHLPLMQWNFKDELGGTSRQVVNAGTPETTYYVYDAGGQRMRKITEQQNGAKKNERFYIGDFEIYFEFDAGGAITLKREMLHVMDNKQRIALVETKTRDNGMAIASPAPAQRYQMSNHLGSASLELDEASALISYEEYSPYGSTAYQTGRNATEVSLKRYRYTGRERDEESGLYYHGARYYAVWLGRWTAADRAGVVDDINLYGVVRNNPLNRVDPSGMWSWKSFAKGALKAVGWIAVGVVAVALIAGVVGAGVALIAGSAIGALVASAIYVGAAAWGGVQTGKSVYEAATSEEHTWTGTGRPLTDEETSEAGGAAVVGALSLGVMGRGGRAQRIKAQDPLTGNKALAENLIQYRAETGIPGEATTAQARSGKGLSDIAESRPIPGTETAVHAEPQVFPQRGGTVVVDQIPCSTCASGALLRGTEVAVPKSTKPTFPGQPRLGPKGVARKAAAGRLDWSDISTRTVIPGQQLSPFNFGELVPSKRSETEWVDPNYFDPVTGQPIVEIAGS